MHVSELNVGLSVFFDALMHQTFSPFLIEWQEIDV